MKKVLSQCVPPLAIYGRLPCLGFLHIHMHVCNGLCDKPVKINENIAFYVVSAGARLQKQAFSRGRTVKINENIAFYMLSAGAGL